MASFFVFFISIYTSPATAVCNKKMTTNVVLCLPADRFISYTSQVFISCLEVVSVITKKKILDPNNLQRTTYHLMRYIQSTHFFLTEIRQAFVEYRNAMCLKKKLYRYLLCDFWEEVKLMLPMNNQICFHY